MTKLVKVFESHHQKIEVSAKYDPSEDCIDKVTVMLIDRENKIKVDITSLVDKHFECVISNIDWYPIYCEYREGASIAKEESYAY